MRQSNQSNPGRQSAAKCRPHNLRRGAGVLLEFDAFEFLVAVIPAKDNAMVVVLDFRSGRIANWNAVQTVNSHGPFQPTPLVVHRWISHRSILLFRDSKITSVVQQWTHGWHITPLRVHLSVCHVEHCYTSQGSPNDQHCQRSSAVEVADQGQCFVHRPRVNRRLVDENERE